jgi:hypothetical protein
MDSSSFKDYWQSFLEGSTPTSAFAAAVCPKPAALARVLRDRLSPTGLCPPGTGLGQLTE